MSQEGSVVDTDTNTNVFPIASNEGNVTMRRKPHDDGNVKNISAEFLECDKLLSDQIVKVEELLVICNDKDTIQRKMSEVFEIRRCFEDIATKLLSCAHESERANVNLALNRCRKAVSDIIQSARTAVEQLRQETISSKRSSKSNKINRILIDDEPIPATNFANPVPHQAELAHASDNRIPYETRNASGYSQPSLNLGNYQLPMIKINIFAGNVLEFPAWETAFEALVERKSTFVAQKLNLLSQYLIGEPRELVQGYLLLQTEEAYYEAKARLKARYGNDSIIAKAFIDKLNNWPRIHVEDSNSLQKYADFINQVAAAKRKVHNLRILDFPQETTKILSRLPQVIVSRWREAVLKWKESNIASNYPPFEYLVAFLNKQAEQENIPELQCLDVQQVERRFPKQQRHARSCMASSNEATSKLQMSCNRCLYCKQMHHLDNCSRFDSLPRAEKLEFLRDGRICYSCGSSTSHIARFCNHRVQCRICHKKHLTTLHINRRTIEDANNRCTRVCGSVGEDHGCDNAMIVPVWVRSRGNPNNETLCYCILDDQSNKSFITENLCQQLNVRGIRTHLNLSTVHRSNVLTPCHRIRDLEVLSYDKSERVPLSSVFTRPEIAAKSSQISRPETAKQWKHLEGISDKIIPYRKELEIGLLIGSNVPSAIRPREIIAGREDDPYAQRSILGWGIVGIVCKDHQNCNVEAVVNKCFANCVPSLRRHNLVSTSRAKEVLLTPSVILNLLHSDFIENNQQFSLSIDDTKFIRLLQEGIIKLKNGHYKMPLPLRNRDLPLPNNRPLALKRLMQLRRRFMRSPKYSDDYKRFMGNVLKNCAEEIPEDQLLGKLGKVNYVPHTGVYHKIKSEKIRVVFDCSAEYERYSLNNNLLQGPDLSNCLVGVLLRFRKEKVAITSDIEAMFHQFFVQEEDRDYLRFLWWQDNNFINGKVKEYRMTVHLFGAASSPGVANFGLKRAADDGEANFGSDAAEFVRNNFYVDDGLISVPTCDEAVSLIRASKNLCAEAGLRLHKITSNKREVMLNIPISDRASEMSEINLNRDRLPIQRVLGMVWCVQNDAFKFRIELKDKPLTRRNMLSTVCSIYDPLSLLGPVVLEGKRILQEMCKTKADWDDPLPDYLSSRWQKWRNDLIELDRLEIQRSYKPKQFGEVKDVSIHHFSDASLAGYGQCSYLRLVDDRDRVHCTLLIGKSRVIPLKPVTVPRLELTAAVVSAKMSAFLQQNLHYKSYSQYFWVDSKVVIGYLNNEVKRFNIFVANRVQQILDVSAPTDWHYVRGINNPADCASRGMTSRQLTTNCTWFRGPPFLWEKEIAFPSDPAISPDIDAFLQTEMKKATAYKTVSKEDFILDVFDIARLDYFSDWFRAKRAVANCLRLREKYVTKILPDHVQDRHMERARNYNIKKTTK
ncbi:uncharacterized protein LOC144750543 [Ciona intestinalis]